MEIDEIWKDIPNYEGYYQVSNLGNVRSIDRVIKNRKAEYLLKGKDIKFLINGGGYNGYFDVVLSKEGVQKRYRVHQLVAMAFLNHEPNGFKKVVNHKNFDKLDNRLENLEIISARENCNKKHLKSTSIYTGVSWEKNTNKWKSIITIKSQLIYLGRYEDEIQASEIYELAVKLVDKYNGIPKDFRELVKKEYEQITNRSIEWNQ